jgi:hypothetical protein
MHRLLRPFVLLLLAVFQPSAAQAGWHPSLYLDGGGWWPRRIKVALHHDGKVALEGTPVAIGIGAGPGQAALVGRPAESVRVCDEKGTELMFALCGHDGRPVAEEPAENWRHGTFK